jgi:carbonic anhydrase
MPTVADEILRANSEYAVNHELLPIGPRPTRHLIVLTCMDTRISMRILGLKQGEAHILRNAGGIVTEDVLRSIIVSHHFLGTQEVVIINHTDCGMLLFQDHELRERLTDKYGTAAIAPSQFHAFTHLEKNVREQIQKLRSHPWIANEMPITGFVYHVETGRLTSVPE